MDWKTFTDELTAISTASALLFDNLRALLNPVSPAISAFATNVEGRVNASQVLFAIGIHAIETTKLSLVSLLPKNPVLTNEFVSAVLAYAVSRFNPLRIITTANLLTFKPSGVTGGRLTSCIQMFNFRRAMTTKTTKLATPALNLTFLNLEQTAAPLAGAFDKSRHDDFPYSPYERWCGKAIGLAFQTGNYSVLSHLVIVPYKAASCKKTPDAGYVKLAQDRLAKPWQPLLLDA